MVKSAMNDDMSKYKEIFLSEAHGLVHGMNVTLVQWEKSPNKKTNLQDIFRMAHTLKSIAATMRYQHIAELSHAIEDLLDAIRNDLIQLSDCTDLLFNCIDFLKGSLTHLSEGQPELEAPQLIQKIKTLLTSDVKVSRDATMIPAHSTIESISTIEVKVERLDKLLNLTKELLINKMKLETLSESIQSSELTSTVDIVNRTISELQYHVMQIRLVPIGFVFDRFIRLIRDLAKQQKKEVELQTEGASTELDRSLIDAIGESLAHLLKNAVDHGLETPKVRIEAHKPSTGKILLTAKRIKESILIEVSDDGRGLDLPAIKKEAMNKKILTSPASREEIINSIFSAISTSKKVTAISGRGLGLCIVKKKIETINGTIEVTTEERKGTKFSLTIPLSLAVILVLLIKHANDTYAIQLDSVERLLMVHSKDIKGFINDEAFIYNNKSIPILRLSKLFNLKVSSYLERQSMIVLRKDGSLLGLIVDHLMTTEEIITQPLNAIIKRSKFFSGTALLGSGETILVLDVEQLFLSHSGFKKEESAKI